MFPQEKEEILSKQGEELSDLQEQLLRARESGKFDKIWGVFFGESEISLSRWRWWLDESFVWSLHPDPPAHLHSWNYFSPSCDDEDYHLTNIVNIWQTSICKDDRRIKKSLNMSSNVLLIKKWGWWGKQTKKFISDRGGTNIRWKCKNKTLQDILLECPRTSCWNVPGRPLGMSWE